jgi:multidrug efflux system membrane fusion protein
VRTYLIAIGILVLLGLWMASGLFFGKETGLNREASVDKLTKVRVQALEAQKKQINIELRGRTEAKRIVDITAEISGKLIQTPVEKGEHVKKGDVLCQLAEEDRPVQLSRARANLEKAQIDYDGSMKLYVDGMISPSVLANSRAQLETEKAAVIAAQLNINYLHMRAPFDAYVEDRPAKVGASIERGAVCARLMDESLMLATGQLSEKQVHLAQVGQKAKVV